MTERSHLTCNIDLTTDGKRSGFLAVPQSTNSAGWAKYFVPISVIRNGEGPTAVLFGGNHGDEYEGPVTLMNLTRELSPEQISGRVILMPMLNHPAVAGGTRLSPIDGVNMNRAFPGSPRDSITGQIAHYVATEILPAADLVIDIHSGGSSMHMLPSVNMHRMENREQMDGMLAAARAWGAPYIFLYADIAGSGLLPTYAESLGKVTLGTEMGSKAQFGVEMLRHSARVRNVLHHAGILKECPNDPGTTEPLVVAAEDEQDYIMSPSSGIYEPFFEIGDAVEAGQAVGQLHSIEHPERDPEKVFAASSGILFTRRSVPLTKQGECLAVITREVKV
ncbi:MAG: succinylglutamate desuccinylase/aspartoacylase family protein [Planctomycetota bacterium]|nr:succinylglutamate desuccinylase/aspartoacylase family protein [Planctomycetota bacterium]MDA1252144.1 succinylglutamate desuccinylase/aspartoacylase family protein [Planctomycetota bacterium]